MRFSWLLCVLILSGLSTTAFAQDRAPTTTSAKTGEFETTFKEKSPHSASSELAKRFVDNAPHIHDYDPSQYPFIVYVPPASSSSDPHSATDRPPGLIVLINREAADTIPQVWLPVFDKHHFIFASLKPYVGDPWLAGALAMDAVTNIKKQYAIDPKRIYFVGFMGGAYVALSTSDVFTGNICVWGGTYFKSIASTPGQYFAAQDTPPPPQLLALAKKEPQVRTTDSNSQWADGPNDLRTLLPRQMRNDGFLHVLGIDVPHPDGSYPQHVAVSWFELSLDYLDSINVPKKRPTTRMTSRPATVF